MFRPFALFGMVAVGLTFSMLTVQAEPVDSAADQGKPGIARVDQSALNQEILSRQFREFEQSLLRVAQRLERSTKPEDRERAANLKKAIALASQERTDAKFDKLVSILKSSQSLSLQEIRDAMDQNKMLADDIRAILALLLTDNRDDEIKREKKRLAELLKMIDAALRNQKLVRAQTEAGRMEKDPLLNSQNKVTKSTTEIAKAMSKDAKNSDKANASKSDKKPGDKSESKNKEANKGENNKSEGKGKPGKAGSKEKSKGQGKGQSQNPDQGKEDKKVPGQQPSPANDPQPSDSTPGKKQVQDANNFQKQAEDDIKKEDRAEASKKQDKAISELEKARKKLEEILKQLREEEIERVLAALEARCKRMLQMQIEVYDGTVRVDKAVATNPDKKPTRLDEQKSLQLSDREQQIVDEANKAIQILEADGSAVAFPEVFIQIRDDMKHVTRRLGKVDVGSVTQTIEKDYIIATLKEMIAALQKARQNLSNPPGPSGPQGPPRDQRLIELLAELKMIRSMQLRVNSRTLLYSEKYTGEQAADPEIQKELVDLAQRQQKIFDVTNNIYRGKNR